MTTGEAVWMTYRQPSMGATKEAASSRSACVQGREHVNHGVIHGGHP